MKNTPLLSSLFLISIAFLFTKCEGESFYSDSVEVDTAVSVGQFVDTTADRSISPIATINVNREAIVQFAEGLKGIQYNYGGTDPKTGFDCSGFITYVFSHFNVPVPRSSVDFTNVGREVPVTNAKRGDLILFTGTDSLTRIVGHMGIVTSNTDTLKFIHSTSGKAYGVTETTFGDYYRGRFVKVIDIY